MENSTNKWCCFIGHRKTDKSIEFKNKVYCVIKKLINSGFETFLFGSKSEFDNLCYGIVSDMKTKYPNIKWVYVRAEYPDIDQENIDYLLKNYEETYYPDKIRNSGRAAYVERNRYMIDISSVCVFYCVDNYTPPKKAKKANSGTKIAYDYAVHKKKNVINTAPKKLKEM